MHDQTIIKCGQNLTDDRVQKNIRTYTDPYMVLSIKKNRVKLHKLYTSEIINNLQNVNCTSEN